ncbi:hypothetical protein TNCV_3473561 [Trichonephila clavipes]|nr:hypothetical protein TNCV_3473561 [Trichonephila clavipes]
MTSAWPWGHCLCLNSEVKKAEQVTIMEQRWRDGQVCPDVGQELWRLGPGGPEVCLACYCQIGRGGQERLLLPANKKERGRVVNTLCVSQGFFFRREGKKGKERREGPALDGEKEKNLPWMEKA